MDLRRKILATKSGQGLDEVFTPPWQFYTALLFLVPSVTPRESVSNLSTTNEGESSNQVTLQGFLWLQEVIHRLPLVTLQNPSTENVGSDPEIEGTDGGGAGPEPCSSSTVVGQTPKSGMKRKVSNNHYVQISARLIIL